MTLQGRPEGVLLFEDPAGKSVLGDVHRVQRSPCTGERGLTRAWSQVEPLGRFLCASCWKRQIKVLTTRE
jgi:hypothetical protein